MKSNNDYTNLLSQVKFDLINYYDSIKSEIDIISQECMLSYENKQKTELIHNKTKNLDDIKQLTLLNKELIDKVETIFNLNCQQVDNYYNYLSSTKLKENCFEKELFKKNALKNYCCFIDSKKLTKILKNSNQIGILVIADWYLDASQLNYLK